jgi:hypothetical protein
VEKPVAETDILVVREPGGEVDDAAGDLLFDLKFVGRVGPADTKAAFEGRVETVNELLWGLGHR